MGHDLQPQKEDRDSLLSIQLECLEVECQRLRVLLPEDMVIMLVLKEDLNHFLDRLQAAPLFFVLENEGKGNEGNEQYCAFFSQCQNGRIKKED